jgi:tetratricopeptide (TPR) repeat protein
MDDAQRRRQTWLVCLGLALAVLAAYAPVWRAGFITYDDPAYVTANPHVQGGLSWAGLVWAFTTGHASNWHPLTWISHMLDFQLYGMNPAGHHLTSVALHLANSILLFLLLQRMTKAMWSSAMVAALFALHPMHVESVAWVSERKDVLSTLFWMLAVGAYVRYAENLKSQISNFKFFYIGSVVLFGLGLMAKPMLVTLPFILLLLDYWPLQRLQPPAVRLLAEKIPWFILAAASCVVTFLAQQRSNSVMSLVVLPLGARLENVPIAYARYLGKTFWPADLAVLYPLPRQWPVWEVACSTALLALITAWVIWRVRAQPYLAVGWLWFLGMLAPVIGLVHIGSQSMADRYDYVPSVGLFIMIIWAAREWLPRLGAQAPVVLGGLAVAGCMALTWMQAQYWQDSETLFRHALAVTEQNGLMESNLGKVLFQEGRVDEALPHLFRAVAFAPDYPLPHYNLGNALLARGKVAGALAQFEIQVALQPGDPIAQYNFGSVLLAQGLAQDAIPHLEKAVQIRPHLADYHCKLGDACRQAGRAAEAVSQYEKSLQILPKHAKAASSLAWMLATNPDPSLRNGARAVQLALLADQLSRGQDPKVIGVLAAAYAETGDFSKAAATVQRALQLAGAESDSALAETLRAQLALYRAGSPFRDAEERKK